MKKGQHWPGREPDTYSTILIQSRLSGEAESPRESNQREQLLILKAAPELVSGPTNKQSHQFQTNKLSHSSLFLFFTFYNPLHYSFCFQAFFWRFLEREVLNSEKQPVSEDDRIEKHSRESGGRRFLLNTSQKDLQSAMYKIVSFQLTLLQRSIVSIQMLS